MALVVETGAIVAGANSYASLADVRLYGGLYDLALPADDAALEVAIRVAMDYIESFADRWKGDLVRPNAVTSTDDPPVVSIAQPLSWPRKGVIIGGREIASDAIPQAIKGALCRLAYEQASGNALFRTTTKGDAKGAVVREKVDVLEVQYSDSARTMSAAERNAPGGIGAVVSEWAMMQLAPYLRTADGVLLSAIRV